MPPATKTNSSPPGQLDAHRARLDARDQWRVARVDAQFAGFAGQRHERRLAREDRLLGAHHVHVNGIGHAFSWLGVARETVVARISVHPAQRGTPDAEPEVQTFLAFSIASSMVPTM
jgi:hypothetical protein